MTPSSPRAAVDRALALALYSLLALFVAVTTHNFFAYIGHYPYWSIDDGLSVVSTSWLQTGRYGDPAVPIEGFSDLQRYRGFFIYGPWPFAAGQGDLAGVAVADRVEGDGVGRGHGAVLWR